MNKIKKIALTLLIWLLTIFFISVVQNYPLSISATSIVLYQIPLIYWIVMLFSPFLLYIIAKDSKNPLVPMVCVVLYYFLFFSFGIYFFSSPTIGDISTSARFQEILSSVSHINPQGVEQWYSASRYFHWPVFFFFSKIFTSILGIGSILTLNLGFFSLLLISPVLLTLYYKRSNNNFEYGNLYFILPALYITVGWYFINSQFVPQFISLIYLFILFGCYAKYRYGKNPSFLFFMIIFYVLVVFSHSFIFIFFLVAIVFEVYWSEYVEMKKIKFISYGLLIIFFAILYPYLSHFYSLAVANVGGESWGVFQSFLSQKNQFIPTYGLQSLLILDQLFASVTRVVLVTVIAIVAIGLLLYILKEREMFDLSVLIGSASWFALGLANLVLGQRALQVAALPLSRHFNYSNKLFIYLSRVMVVLILIAPSLFVANVIINYSIDGGRLIQDYEENIAGRFMDNHIINVSTTITNQNPYPTGYPYGFRRLGIDNFLKPKDEQDKVDFILDSPKLQKRLLVNGISLPEYTYTSVVYHNRDIQIFTYKYDN
jgi:hypothetical protein